MGVLGQRCIPRAAYILKRLGVTYTSWKFPNDCCGVKISNIPMI
jgi:hypothetical protein